jgi:hypothetical protein
MSSQNDRPTPPNAIPVLLPEETTDKNEWNSQKTGELKTGDFLKGFDLGEKSAFKRGAIALKDLLIQHGFTPEEISHTVAKWRGLIIS